MQIEHRGTHGAHDTSDNRYLCAIHAAYKVAVQSQNKTVGSVMDLSSYGKDYWKGFYLNHIIQYAKESDINNLGFEIEGLKKLKTLKAERNQIANAAGIGGLNQLTKMDGARGR